MNLKMSILLIITHPIALLPTDNATFSLPSASILYKEILV